MLNRRECIRGGRIHAIRVGYNNLFSSLNDEVIDAGLRMCCGSCVGLCPNKELKIEDLIGDCLPI